MLDPSTIKADAFTASFDMLQPVLLKALETEQDQDIVERGVMAAGIAKAGQLLSRKYTLQITNVPYLAKGKQDEVMATFAEKNYPEAKSDLATVFFDKMLKTSKGTACSVMPQNWSFLTSYRRFREKLLKSYSWNFFLRLGEHAFNDTAAAGAFASLICISNELAADSHAFFVINAANNRGERPIYASEKKDLIKTKDVKMVMQKEQLGNPDLIISFESINKEALLGNYANAYAGIDTGDGNRFKFKFWELPLITNDWIVQLNSFDNTVDFAGRNHILYWQDGKGDLLNVPGARIQNVKFWYKKGIYVVRMAKTPSTISYGKAWDRNGAMIIPKKESDLLPIWEYTKTSEFRQNLRKLNQKLSISEATFPRVSFNLEYWQKVAAEKYPNGLPKPYSDDPTQWLFHGHPKQADNPLQVAVARMMGYRWPAESDEEMELDERAREYIAQIKAFDHLTDDDGILCIPPVNGVKPAAEVLREYLREVWGSEWGNQTPNQLLQQEGSNKPNLEQWLREEFFIQHCKVFNNRPFIWHIWDGRKDGFAALVNYYKLDQAALKKLSSTYLNDYIRQCELKQKDGESGADGLLMAARKLKEKLELILAGEPPYDIFVRWKPLHQQPIGWNPDLNDGVRLNIYPFIQAGILRKNPNINRGKDRGKNPDKSTWGPDRYNRYEDLDDKYKLKDENGKVIEHLSNEVKRGAREEKQ